MRIMAILLALVLASPLAFAQSVYLKCDLEGVDNGPGSESWIEVNGENNLLRVSGVAIPLMMTNDFYGGITAPTGRFRTKYEINRNTGEILITEFGGRTVIWERKGSCIKADPPSKKF